jgi:hypothetical protein
MREPMTKTITTIGPADHGRHMDLDEFAEAIGEKGRVYELSRGIISMVEIPKKRQLPQVAAVRDQLQFYKSQASTSLFCKNRLRTREWTLESALDDSVVENHDPYPIGPLF